MREVKLGTLNNRSARPLSHRFLPTTVISAERKAVTKSVAGLLVA